MSEHKSATPQTKLQRVHTFIDVVRRALKARDDADTKLGAARTRDEIGLAELAIADASKLENEARAAAYAAVKLIIANKIELREPGDFVYHDERKPPAPKPPPAPPRYATPDDFLNEIFRAAGVPPPNAHRPAPPRPPPDRRSFGGAPARSRRDGWCDVCQKRFTAGADVLISVDYRTAHADCGFPIPVTPKMRWASHLGTCALCTREAPFPFCLYGNKIFEELTNEKHGASSSPPPTDTPKTDWARHHDQCPACSRVLSSPHIACEEGWRLHKVAFPTMHTPGDRTAPRRPTITIDGVTCPVDEVNVKWSPRPSYPPEDPREYSSTYTPMRGRNVADVRRNMLSNHVSHCRVCQGPGPSQCVTYEEILHVDLGER